jgi:ubiquinone/menaquinone biosynthesis C-methylase UbiE
MITVDFKSLPITPHCRILDIGCGNGRHTAAAFDLNSGHVVGADPQFNDLKDAHDRMRFHESLGPGGRWSLAGADITHLPFKETHFDIVLCAEVLEHIPDHKKAIAECARVLKKGGHLVVSVPRRWPEAICWALSRKYRETQGGHLRIYSKRPLIDMIQSAGMRHWRSHYAHSLHAPFWWLKCLLGKNRDGLWPIRQYHRLLTWDIMHKPAVTRTLERILNPPMGKSVVLYFTKTA